MHLFHHKIAAGHEAQVAIGLVGAMIVLFDVESQADDAGIGLRFAL